MNNDLEMLEQEVEAEWSALGLDFAVEPSTAVVERVRSAVRQELNEDWLSGQPQPVPGDDLLNRVTVEVRHELARVAENRATMSRLRRRLAAGMAVAAAILLVIGVSRFGSPIRVSAGFSADADVVERFAQAADEVWSADPLTREMGEDLDALEESMTQWPSGSDSEPESIEDLHTGPGSPLGDGVGDGLSDSGGRPAGARA